MRKKFRDSVNLYNKLIEKRVKASIEISFNQNKQLSKEASAFFSKVYIQKITKKINKKKLIILKNERKCIHTAFSIKKIPNFFVTLIKLVDFARFSRFSRICKRFLFKKKQKKKKKTEQ